MKRAAFKHAKKPVEEGFMNQQTVVEKQPVYETQNSWDSEKKDVPSRRQRLDPITAALNQTGYFHQMNWPWMHVDFGGIKYPLYVDRYYPALKLALDQGQNEHTEIKKELCEKNKINFFVISGLAEIEDIKQKLGELS